MDEEESLILSTNGSTDVDLPYNTGFVVILTLLGSIGGFLFGYDSGIIAGAQLYLKDTWPEISTVERELVVSLALLGAFVGSLIAGSISDNLGRKPVIIVGDILFTVGSIVMATAETIATLMAGRFIVGLGIGIASMILPVYLSEVAPISIRGKVVTSFVIAITLGQLISSIVALGLAPSRDWRLMLGLAAIPSLIQGFAMICMPESQRWLGKKEKTSECIQVLNRVYPRTSAEKELRAIGREVEKLRPYLSQTECQRYSELFQKYGRCLYIGCMLQFF